MGFEIDEELYEDFLVETGETLEQLGEHLVDLENAPEDQDLLNKVFRGFHNIKGGAGFLSLTNLVEACHKAEDVFNVLRQGERTIDSELMDVVLQVLDVINDMVDTVREREEPASADPALLEQLGRYAQPAGADPAPVAEPTATAEPATAEPAAVGADAPANGSPSQEITDDEYANLLNVLDEQSASTASDSPSPAAVSGGQDSLAADEISDDEFEDLLDELHGKGKHGGAPKADATPAANSAPAETGSAPARDDAPAADEISDDEFEDLLDELHGKGKHGGAPKAGSAPAAAASSPAETSTAPGQSNPSAAVAADEISDDEFEDLLDELHGKGKHGGAPKADATPPAASPKPASTPAAAPRAESAPARPASPAAAREKPARGKPAKEGGAPASESTVRVDTQRLDDMMNMVGELVLVRNRMANLALTQTDEELATAISNLDVVTADLQVSVMKTRMQPIKKVFGRFPRVVRDLARSLKKEVSLELNGEETDLDKNLVEALADPLVHLVRNAVDHGLEMPDEREAAGKPRVGTVVLTAEQEGDHILLTIEDDGKGMDAEALRGKAVEKGMMDEDAAARLDEQDCYNLIFSPGFSTKTEISDVSGRGVGMDVVKTRITQLNGSINIDTAKGKGTRLEIKVPLTLAIMPTLMVKIGEQVFAMPLLSIIEIIEYNSSQTKTIDGQLVVMLRDKALPLFHLREWLLNGAERNSAAQGGHVLITGYGAQRAGLVVDQLVGQEEVVIKPLGSLLHGTAGLAGATITGNGKIALILDLPGLIKAYGGRMWGAA
jgi:two-component system chemotaxis sensor kinase CheA